MKLNLNRSDIIQIISTISSFVVTILLPLVNYITFRSMIGGGIKLDGLESRYDIIIIFVIIIGVMITGCTYLFFNFSKFSINRGIAALTHSILDVLFLVSFSQMAVFSLLYEGSGVYIDLSTLFLLLVIIVSLFMVKNLYDLIDFKINKNYYQTLLRKQRMKAKKTAQKLIKCPNCMYMCQKSWIKCPVCNSKLKTKNNKNRRI